MTDYLSWLAGFMDAEGSISITIRGQGSPKNLEVRINVSITQHTSRRAVLEDIVKYFGFGSIMDTAPNISFFQTTSRGTSKAVIEKLLPYLCIKQDAAEAALKAINILDSCAGDGVSRGQGDRLLSREAAISLVELATSINLSPITQERTVGTSKAALLNLIEEIYSRPKIPSKKKVLECKVCSLSFERYPSNIGEGPFFFCSKKCDADWKRATSNVKYKAEITCSACSKVFFRKKSDVKPENNFCSCSCSNRFRAQEKKKLLLTNMANQ